MKRPKLTYRINTKQELSKWESLKTHLRKLGSPVKDSLHGGPSRVSSPPVGHPTAYGKFVMNKHTKAENLKKIDIYQWISQPQNPLFLIRLILDREKEVLSLKLRDFIPEIKMLYS